MQIIIFTLGAIVGYIIAQWEAGSEAKKAALKAKAEYLSKGKS